MKVTDEQRSMIASAFVAAFNAKPVDGVRNPGALISLCCAPDASEAARSIVGARKVEALRTFVYERLGCAGSHSDLDYHERTEQYFLDAISELETL